LALSFSSGVLAGIVDLMKKGLRRVPIRKAAAPSRRNRRPDEEGIKTRLSAGVLRGWAGIVDLMKKGLRRKGQRGYRPLRAGIVDLMKKGLRRLVLLLYETPDCRNRRPDEEGIKTSCNSLCCSMVAGIVDLMKKGLRRLNAT